MSYESRLREALEQDRRVAAAMVASQRRQLTAGQLTAECDRLRAELERLRTDHETQLRQSELNYQQGLATYRQLIENNVSDRQGTHADLLTNREGIMSSDQRQESELEGNVCR